MRKNKHGYTPAALLLNDAIKKMRDHVEYEKFVCRVIKDNETTRQFKLNTEQHPNSVYRFHYNSKAVEAHTAAGKKSYDERQGS